MNKKKQLVLLIMLSTIVGGCNFEYTSDIKEENSKLKLKIEKYEKYMSEAPTIDEEISRLNEQVDKKKAEIEEFKKKYPEVVEYVRKNDFE